MPENEPTATERLVSTLADLFGNLTDLERVRLEDAFNDAVDARVQKALAEARRD